MPWASNDDLPDSVRSALPADAQTRFRQVANGRMAAGDPEESAIRQAWTAVKNGWERPEDGGKWVRKAGARHTRAEFEQIQQMHDLAVSLGASCGGHEDDEDYGKTAPVTPAVDGVSFIKIELIKFDENLGLVLGWAIVCKEDGEPYFDTQGDHIPEDAMLKASAEFMAHSRVAKEMHRGDPVGAFVFAFPVTDEICKAMGIESRRTGLMVGVRPSADVLAKARAGKLTGFSIGGKRVVDERV